MDEPEYYYTTFFVLLGKSNYLHYAFFEVEGKLNEVLGYNQWAWVRRGREYACMIVSTAEQQTMIKMFFEQEQISAQGSSTIPELEDRLEEEFDEYW